MLSMDDQDVIEDVFGDLAVATIKSGKSGKGKMKKMTNWIKKIVNKGKVAKAKGKVMATMTMKGNIIASSAKYILRNPCHRQDRPHRRSRER